MVTIATTDSRLQQQKQISVGPYVQGSKPRPLAVVFIDQVTKAVIDISGYTPRLVYKDATLADGIGTEVNGTIASVSYKGTTVNAATYQWVAADLATPGLYVATMWVGNGTQLLASRLIAYTVKTSEVAIPTGI